LEYATLPGECSPDGLSPTNAPDADRDCLRHQRTDELWAGLRRIYFGEVEDPLDSKDTESSAKRPRTRENVAAFKREIADTRDRLRRFGPPVPDDLNLPPGHSLPRHWDEDDDADSNSSMVIVSSNLGSDNLDQCGSDLSLPGGVSDGEKASSAAGGDKGDNGGGPSLISTDDDEDVYHSNCLSARCGLISPVEAGLPKVTGIRTLESGESEIEEKTITTFLTLGGPLRYNLTIEEDASFEGLGNDNHAESSQSETRNGVSENGELDKGLSTFPDGQSENGELEKGVSTFADGQSKRKLQSTNFGDRKILSVKTMRRILNFKESLMKYGVFVPKNDNEADASPEHVRWTSGRHLEWIRLQTQGTFARNWDWAKVHKHFPAYRKCDVGHVFFVYDFKYSGEHRVRLVFDGSRQNPETYTDTYAPTGRGESVRLFHIVGVEEGWEIAQYDVPQAFLKSKIDCDIFVYPPRNFAEFPGQLLKLNLSLYGAKQSAALWNQLIDAFLREIGFSPSPMDPCLYKRKDALIILFVDDLRVAASSTTLVEIHAALFQKFQITTSDGTRFLGMDTIYDLKKGYLKLHMETYIISIHERFHSFDLSAGVPFREIVGCLLWVCLCVMGPELLRVKDLARLSNEYTEADFKSALKVLDRIYLRRTHGLVIVRGGADTELVPSSSRLVGESSVNVLMGGVIPNDNIGTKTKINDLREKALYKVKDEIADVDISPIILPLNKRYSLIIYSDASFAIGETKQSVSGYVVFLNGTPLLFGSLKQTIVVDSSCSAEYVAASIACKQAIHAENMIGFLGFSCAKPYVMYTDSTACLSIATNSLRLGNVRHLAIRYNLVRCYVTIGEITMRYCVTEEMIADLLTKIVVGAQDDRLSIRFYNLCPAGAYYVVHHV
jgi:hypothetical protein